MNLNKIRQNKYFKNIIRDRWLIGSIMAIIIFWTLIYLITLYKPVYTSKAKVWVKNIPDQNFVNVNFEQAPFPPLNPEFNPILTQLEILKSYHLLSHLANYIQKNYPKDLKNVKNKVETAGQLLSVKNKVGTETIDISIKTDSPQKSRDLLGVVLKEYENISLALNKKINSQRRMFIDKQLADVASKLLGVRNKIRQYNMSTLTTSLDEESNGLVRQRLDFISQLENVNALIRDAQGKIRSYQRRLSLNMQDALDAVALGSDNENLTALRAKLNEVQQQYSFDSINFATTNPRMVAARKQINTIKGQIQDQIRRTLGKNLNKQEINILDPVRQKLVEELAMTQANYLGLIAQRNSLQSSISRIKRSQSQIPSKKFVLDNLIQEERNLSVAYDELRVKQIDSRLKEAETVSNITIVDEPNLPVTKSFPTKTQIMILALMVGGILGIGTSIIKTSIEDKCEGVEAIEDITKSPVLGIVPWIKSHQNERSKLIQSFAIKNTVSNLISQCYKKNARVLTFASTSTQKSRSYLLYMIASSLTQLGHSVVVVDSDLAVPLVLKDAKLSEMVNVNLSDLLLDVEKKLKYRQDISTEFILSKLTLGKNNLQLLGNIDPIDSPYEYFGSMAFKKIISILRNSFDWVLIDSPSVNIAPEFMTISESSDGLVLFTSLKVTNASLNRTIRRLKAINTELLGTIIREQNSILEKDYAESVNRLSVIYEEDLMLDDNVKV